ncbi:MAG TPA: hypothetical protein VGR62_09830 [Candidatus Binatia bacterium]|nr:hypothetical protein [Candidatus Binatia bacterium]
MRGGFQVAVVAMVALALSSSARAADLGVTGQGVTVSVSGSGKVLLKSLQKGPGIAFGPGSASSELSGSLEIWYVDAPANRGTLVMPSPWAANTGTGATYRNAQAPSGPSLVKTASVKAGKVAKVLASATGGLSVATPPGPGGVITVLTIDNAGDGSRHRMCSRYQVSAGSKIAHRAIGSGAKLTLKKGVPTPCPSCSDLSQNGTETGIDCGGGACAACGIGQGCGAPSDCLSGICTGNVCQAPSCTDGIKTGNETDIDCGGACPACDDGDHCVVATDCESGVCTSGTCAAPSCSDGIRNGSEIDVDCGGSCTTCVPFTVTIDTPVHGVFSLAASTAITGHTTGVGPAGANLTINGIPVVLSPGGTFSTSMPLSQSAIFNPINAKLVRNHDGFTAYDRVVVIAGAATPAGQASPNGVAMRINDRGFDTIEPVATTLVAIDPSTLVSPGTAVMEDYCYAPLGSVCFGSVDVTISGTPAPQVGPIGIALDSQTNSIDGDITLNGLRVTVNIDSDAGIPIHCELHLTVPVIQLFGDYGLSPMVSQPSKVDVAQVGTVAVQASGTTYQTDCSGLFGDLTESLIGSAIGDVGALFADGMQDFLNQVDGNGNTPIAGAIETALGGIDIAGPVGSGLGIDLYAPFTSIVEDPIGVTFAANLTATTLLPDPNAPQFAGTYHVSEPFPAFGAITPVQHSPYGLGLAISTSGFNQLLRSQIESGLLQSALTVIDLGGGPVQLTAGLLAAAFPPFASLPPALPITIRISPTLAPVLTGAAGPNGELGELRMAQVQVEFVRDAGLPGEVTLMALAVDTRLGLQLAFQPSGIGFVLSTPDASDVTVAILLNPLGVQEAALQAFIPGVVASFLPDIAGALESFPLPQFIGLSIAGIEVSRNGQYYSIFADLSPACTSGTQCPSGVCIASVCQVPTCFDGVENGSETGLDCGGGSCPGCAVGQGCFLGTDCALGGCSGGICQPTCTIGAECPSGVCTGGYCRVPNCADGVQNGAETALDCGGPAPNCVRCANGLTCGGPSDCASGICTAGVCQPPSCTDGARNGTETDVDCGGGCPGCGLGKLCDAGVDCASAVCGANDRCTCGNRLFTFNISSNNGGPFDSAEWPGGTTSQNGPAGCAVTINRPSGNIDQVCTLQPPFSVNSFQGYTQCFGSGGEDGDGCQPQGCPFAGVGSCCSGRPSCSVALNGSGSARYFVQCLE